jgi:hypothetical protein
MSGNVKMKANSRKNREKSRKRNGQANQKKVLLFPAPREEREITQMIVQIGRQRFAIRWEIEDLPPSATPLLLLETPPSRGKRIP